MSQLKRLLMMAEDELTEYSTPARKIEKLRRKISLSVPSVEQREIRQVLEAEAASGGWLERLIEGQRQTVALPFWGVAGLGLLEGFLGQPLGWGAAVVGGCAAIGVQRWGWKLEARRLLLDTFQDIERRLAEEETPPPKED
ncbi:hypothetical protein L1047_03345 [Synechococcus sp. Nb3U1]|uniref:hypothetical protein n=1 Tax=Synechococcus sp. Nb3U1 TaxID=1914529 RepID=UPI001F378FEB|nr:hypothetical protein [Synechococcus sp. Nb3U1]MCF2970229.1 hypothetical protein [Synechococcus sp. Nb3U1]